MQIARRSFIAGMASLIAAPAVVRSGILMPVKLFDPYYRRYIMDYLIGSDCMAVRCDVSLMPLAMPKFANILTEAQAFKYDLLKAKVMEMRPIEGQQLNICMNIPGSWYATNLAA